jgi:uncharacterized protein YbjT (DUF2867 family)
MSKKVLLAGATGSVGFELLNILKENGYWVRTLSCSKENAVKLKQWANEVVIREATKPSEMVGICQGVDVVVSALGASVGMNSKERRSYHQVDFLANNNLLTESKQSKVKRFVYLSVFKTPDYENTAYVQAHELFVQALYKSTLSFTVVRPTGVFSVFSDFLEMAKKGMLPVIGSGQSRSNPIHPKDVAEACFECIEQGTQELEVGGPDILTRKEVAECAFSALGKKARLIHFPSGIFSAVAIVNRLWNKRMAELLEFGIKVATHDCVAPKKGKLHLSDYFREQVNIRNTQ